MAFKLKSISKLLLGATFLLSAEATFATKSASAQQQTVGCATQITAAAFSATIGGGGTAIQCGDKLFKAITPIGNIVPGAKPIDISQVFVSATQVGPTSYLFNTDFGGSSEFFDLVSFQLDYSVQITDPLYEFAAFDIDSQVGTFQPSEVFQATYTYAPGSTIVLTSTNGTQDPAELPVPGNISSQLVTVANRYTGNGGEVSNTQNSFKQRPLSTKVPGPLPIMGASIAFAFSRRLRTRIKAVVAV